VGSVSAARVADTRMITHHPSSDPAYDEFLGRVTQEVEANITRIRHHPSIVIFGGSTLSYISTASLTHCCSWEQRRSISFEFAVTLVLMQGVRLPGGGTVKA